MCLRAGEMVFMTVLSAQSCHPWPSAAQQREGKGTQVVVTEVPSKVRHSSVPHHQQLGVVATWVPFPRIRL